MIRSLRLRLLVHTSLASVLILGLLGFGIYFAMRRSLRSEFDAGLQAKARALAATTEQHRRRIVLDFAPSQMPEFLTRNHPEYFEAWIEGNVLARSGSLGIGDLPRIEPRDGAEYLDMQLPDGRRGRMITMSFPLSFTGTNDDDQPVHPTQKQILLAVATQTAYLDTTIEKLGWLLLGLCSAAVIISGAVLLFIVRRAITPVQRIAQVIEQLRETDLSVRLTAPDAPTELKPVVDKLNGLLARLESAFSREKAFTADVAHELRTPLAGLQTTLEVCRSRPREPGAYVTVVDKCLSMTNRMQNMVATLLMLARAEGCQLSVPLTPVDAGTLLDESWALFAPRATRRNLQLEWVVPEQCLALSNAEKLCIIFHNLFDNAVSHTNEGGTIRIRVSQVQQQLRIEVANTGSQVSADDSRNLFQRFWRGDHSRTDTGTHCGLGLALCERLTQLLKGTIAIETSDGGWFTAILSIPADTASSLARPETTVATSPVALNRV